MYFRQFLNDESGCCSYFIASRASNEAIVVDPEIDIAQYTALAAERGYAIKYVADTHVHADHISGARTLAAVTGAELCMHEACEARYEYRKLTDGEEIHLGPLVLRIMHTPGHRPESISILVINPARSAEPCMVLTGDSLFVGDVGRPDFGGAEGVLEQYRSIQKLLELEDYVEVFPAHFEGSCGKEMSGHPTTTIGFERRFNPLLTMGEREFTEVVSEPMARPLNMNAIVETNLGIADNSSASPTGGPPAHSVSADAAPEWIREHDPLLLDVRELWEYEAGHLPGAVSLPQAEIAERLSEIPMDRELMTICRSGARSVRTARFLKKAGRERVVSLALGTEGWIEAGNPVEKAG